MPKTASTPGKPKLTGFPHRLSLEAYGVRIGVAANSADALDVVAGKIADVLPEFNISAETEPPPHLFLCKLNATGRGSLYKNDDAILLRLRQDIILEKFATEFRLTVAEHAIDRVFVHAGAVVWKGRAIVIPARSFQGKSTLTAELVRRGAIYYSDEYAIIDKEGLVQPFAKKLSIRGEIDAYRQVDHPVEKFGGVAGTVPAPVGMVLITEYKENAKWKPKALSPARGMMEIIKHALPIRRDPKLTLEILGKISNSAVIIKSKRGEVEETADRIIEFFESNCLEESPASLYAAK